MPSPKPGRKRGAEYQIFGAACGRASRERDDESTLLEHDPHIIIVRPRGGSAVKNGCGMSRMVCEKLRAVGELCQDGGLLLKNRDHWIHALG